jgi:hypothetical protein
MLIGIPPSEDKIWLVVDDSSVPGISWGQAGAFRTALCLDLNLSVVVNIIGSQEKAKFLTSVPGLWYCTHSKLPLILALASQAGELLSLVPEGLSDFVTFNLPITV